MHNYSTTEQRIGTWHNGKPIYERCFVGLSVSLTTTWQNLADLSSSNVDEIVSVDALGTYYNSKGSLIAVNAGQIAFINGYVQGYKIRDNATVNTVIVQYTKTTD